MSRGHTLIELLIVMALVAMLASIAMPGYRRQVLRSNRIEARTALLNIAAAQEKYYLQNNAYANQSALSAAPPAGLGLAGTTANGWYSVVISAADTAGFSASATATGTQVADADCATFTINQIGLKGATRSDGSVATACWN